MCLLMGVSFSSQQYCLFCLELLERPDTSVLVKNGTIKHWYLLQKLNYEFLQLAMWRKERKLYWCVKKKIY